MKFIADENIPFSLVRIIRKQGFDIKVLKEENLTGITDQKLIEISKKEKRVLLTFDKDFCNITEFPLKKHQGIIVLRYKNKHPSNVIKKFSALLNSELLKKSEKALMEIFDDYVKIHKQNGNRV